ncbi:MAG: hypothetical protein LBF27_06585 [Sphingobacterium sp.]|jgi:hypothetical protein|nr:hypothetical protein [Sphingobacterium sp.]
MRIKSLDEAALLLQQENIIKNGDDIMGGKVVDLSDGYFEDNYNSLYTYMDDDQFKSLSNFSYNTAFGDNTFVWNGYLNVRVIDGYGLNEGYDTNTGYYNLLSNNILKFGTDENSKSVYIINDSNFGNGYSYFSDGSNLLNSGYATEELADGYVRTVHNGYEYYTNVNVTGERLTIYDQLNYSYDSEIVQTSVQFRNYAGTPIPPPPSPVFNDPEMFARLSQGIINLKAMQEYNKNYDPLNHTDYISPRRRELEKQFPTVFGGTDSLSSKYQGWNDFSNSIEASLSESPESMKGLVYNWMQILWTESGQNWSKFTQLVDGKEFHTN